MNRYGRARDRRHSGTYVKGSMDDHNGSERVRARLAKYSITIRKMQKSGMSNINSDRSLKHYAIS